MRHFVSLAAIVALAAVVSSSSLRAQAVQQTDFKVLATNKTSTMQKEMNLAAEQGYRFAAVMGGETAFGGKEVVTVFQRGAIHEQRYQYLLLATNKTSTMQKELQQAADKGFNYVGQTVFESTFGGKEVSCILEKDLNEKNPVAYQYFLVATSKTSTFQKELLQAGEKGFEMLGMTVGQTAMGGNELVGILRRRVR